MRSALKFSALFGLCALGCYAQSTSVGRVVMAVSQEGIFIARFIGIIGCIGAAVGMMMGSTHMIGKVGGLVLGLTLALGATPIVTWIQSVV